jgi:uncharacterized membrane-anchored protein
MLSSNNPQCRLSGSLLPALPGLQVVIIVNLIVALRFRLVNRFLTLQHARLL